MENRKQDRPEPPDKSLFMTMMGGFFLLFALAPAYWSFYNFAEYRQTTDFVKELRDKSDTNAAPSEKQEKGERLSILNSQAERYLLEMFLSIAGAIVLFGISALLFIKSWRAKGKKNFYQNLVPNSFPIPTKRIEVRYKNLYGALFWVIIFFFGGMLLLVCYQNLTSKYISSSEALIRSLIIAVPIVIFLVIFIFIMLRANRQVVKIFDISHVIRGDGRQFSWDQFCGKITQTAINRKTQRRYIWRIELAFENGETAWLIPNRITNYNEVFDYIETLPVAVFKENV